MSQNGARCGAAFRSGSSTVYPRTRVTFHHASARSLTRWCAKIPRAERPVSPCEPHRSFHRGVYPFHPAFLWPDTIFDAYRSHPLYFSLSFSISLSLALEKSMAMRAGRMNRPYHIDAGIAPSVFRCRGPL